MLIPRYWAEGRVQSRRDRKQVTVRRFGWSDVSQADAQAMADRRAAEALVRILDGGQEARRELKRAYGGDGGTPIREEIVTTRGDIVMTRNAYGARCLNVPNVFIADLDAVGGCVYGCVTPVLALVVGVALAMTGWGIKIALLGAVGTFAVSFFAFVMCLRFIDAWALRGWHRRAEDRVRRLANQPGWRVRLYRTPLGLRVVALHATFDPTSDEVAAWFRELGTDAIYADMCRRQACFRARVSPKPWRVGVEEHIRPTRGAWPCAERVRPAREAWVREYEAKAVDYASCRLVGEFGDGLIDPAAARFVAWHDAECRVESDLPLA